MNGFANGSAVFALISLVLLDWLEKSGTESALDGIPALRRAIFVVSFANMTLDVDLIEWNGDSVMIRWKGSGYR